MGSSFLIVLLTAFVAFLAVLAGLSLAVTKSVNPDGRQARGVFGGFASALALAFLCGLGAVGTGAFVLAAAVGTAVDKNPIERIEVRRASAQPTEDGDLDRDWRHGPVHLLFTVRGDAGRELVELVREVVDVDRAELDEILTVHRQRSADGTDLRVFEFRLPFSEDDLEDLEHDIRDELDGLRVHLPESVAIHFEGARQFY